MAEIHSRHGMHPIRQPRGSNLCWAAAVAMVKGEGATVATVRTRAAAHGVTMNANGSIPVGDEPNMRRLATAFQLQMSDVRTTPVTLATVQRVLGRGRVAMFGGFNYEASMTALDHAVTLYALIGDGTARHTRISLADPFRSLFHDDWEHFEEQIMADPHFLLYP